MGKTRDENEPRFSCWVCSRRDFAKLAAALVGAPNIEAALTWGADETAATSEGMPALPYRVGPAWPAARGSARVRTRVAGPGKLVWAHVPWRRRDRDASEKAVLLIDARTGQSVQNLLPVEVSREVGEFVFEAPTVPGEYDLYYLPYQVEPAQWAYRIQYDRSKLTADPAWLELHHLQAEQLPAGEWKSLPRAEVVEIQARSEFDRFDPMEVIATRAETERLLAAHPAQDFLLFPEERQFPIRMTDDLPLRWITQGPGSQFRGEARRGEFFVFQIGVFACRAAVEKLSAAFGDLKSAPGATIPALSIRCVSTGGRDWLGRQISKDVSVPAGKVGALWIGIQIPREAAAGNYRGVVALRAPGQREKRLEVSLTVSAKILEDGGDSELWRHSRLRWLDSTVGIDDEVTAPYTSLRVEGPHLSCLGRKVRLGDGGLPESIRCGEREILAGPITFVVETEQGNVAWTGGNPALGKVTSGAVAWESSSRGGKFDLRCQAEMQFDGYMYFALSLEARQAEQVKDIRLEIPFRQDAAVYMMGLARKGGVRPQEWKWAWDVERANNSVWLGDYHAGLQLKLKGTEDTWDIYNLKPAGIPAAWGNDGKGGCTVLEEGGRVVVRAFSGPRVLQAGEKLFFRFGLLPTPVKPLDRAHWRQRYYHIYGPPESAARCGATVINVHQGNDLNPYINYPFLTTDKLSAFVNEAHALGLKVKIYYTVRELSNHVVEFWALRSLGNEIFVDGPGGGGAWLREHAVSNYTPAWHETLSTGELDAAIATTGLSRWHNYYLEGLAWLLRNVEIDGLYLDGIGYDRQIMKRVRKVLDRNRPGSLIDFHSGNEFPFNNLHVSPANKYMEHFPYINSLWFGEGYDYNETPDYWLVEISGIPFGLFSEMLEGNGNPWRGMVYGMTARYYSGADPQHIWKFWDEFGIEDAEMIGYWVPSCPVKTSHPKVLATVYRKNRKALVSLASWAPEAVQCRLEVAWDALQINPSRAKIYAPPIEGFQKVASFPPASEILLEPGKGWLLVLEESKA